MSVIILNGGSLVTGGTTNPNPKFIELTILDNVNLDSQLMREKIFSPFLSLVEYKDDNEVIEFIESHPHLLALYIYTKSNEFKDKILQNTNFPFDSVLTSIRILRFLTRK